MNVMRTLAYAFGAAGVLALAACLFAVVKVVTFQRQALHASGQVVALHVVVAGDQLRRAVQAERDRRRDAPAADVGRITTGNVRLMLHQVQACGDAIAQHVVAHHGQPAVRRILPLSLSFDHRVVTGGEAARFLMALKADLERSA